MLAASDGYRLSIVFVYLYRRYFGLHGFDVWEGITLAEYRIYFAAFCLPTVRRAFQ
jgi:hypothetical protein